MSCFIGGQVRGEKFLRPLHQLREGSNSTSYSSYGFKSMFFLRLVYFILYGFFDSKASCRNLVLLLLVVFIK
jgi:hypothetical protein